MTESILPEALISSLKPEYVSPLVLYLCHDTSTENGGLFEVGGGWVSKLRWERTRGATIPVDEISPEIIRQNWSRITDFTDADHPTSSQEAFSYVMSNTRGKL